MKFKVLRDNWDGTQLHKAGDIVDFPRGVAVNHHFIPLEEKIPELDLEPAEKQPHASMPKKK
jgi:uncharacterized cupin superfamily protein